MIDPSRESELYAALELLFFGYREFTSHPDEVLATRGLQRVHHRILYFVGRNPGITVNGLLGVLGVSKQALHGPLKRLAELGLVASDVDAADRRARCLSLTTSGAELEQELSASQCELMEAVFSAAGAEKEAAWREVMAAIAVGGPRGRISQ
jgi:DNA-binding MarR family transcriptional regulator